jgi:hypothetical protein
VTTPLRDVWIAPNVGLRFRLPRRAVAITTELGPPSLIREEFALNDVEQVHRACGDRAGRRSASKSGKP